MHRLPSTSSILRFRVAALLLWLNVLLTLATVVAFVHAFRERHWDEVVIALGVMGLSLLSVCIQWLFAMKTKCPLCMTPVLAAKNCSKNKKARRLFGSYRLRVATSILFRNCFRCPYCSEPTQLTVRPRNSSRRRH